MSNTPDNQNNGHNNGHEEPPPGLFGGQSINPFVRPGKKAPKPLTPDESCFGCLVVILILLVSVAFWGWYYWKNNPSLHPEGDKAPPLVAPQPDSPELNPPRR